MFIDFVYRFFCEFLKNMINFFCDFFFKISNKKSSKTNNNENDNNTNNDNNNNDISGHNDDDDKNKKELASSDQPNHHSHQPHQYSHLPHHLGNHLKLGSQFSFRVTICEVEGMPCHFADVFCQFKLVLLLLLEFVLLE